MRSVLAASAAFVVVAGSAQAAPPPASAFGRVPAVVDAAISPNGQRVAILGASSDQRFISIATIDKEGLPILQLGEVEAVGVRWAGDDFVLATVAYWDSLGGPGRTARFERQISVTTEAKAAARLLQNAVAAGSVALLDTPVLGVTSAPPARVMMLGLTENGGPGGTVDTRIKRKGQSGAARALWKVDPATGAGALSERGGFDTRSWDVDSNGEARVRIDVDELSGKFTLYGRPKGRSQWTALISNAEPERRAEYRGYHEGDDAILLAKDGKIVRQRLADGEIEPFGDAVESDRMIWDPDRNVVVALVNGPERANFRWLDADIGGAYGVMSRAFKDRNVTLAGWSRDRSKFLVRVSGPSAAPVWYLYDKPRKNVSMLAEEYPQLKDVPLGTMTFTTYKARDGLSIPAFVTLPPGAPKGSKLPLVVMPHGGPAARDSFDFDFLAQFVASRGYAVLQPQFRGSVGFGDALEEAGRGEWGGKAQTDLLDGIAALAATGDIDPTRVCIAGASFGGYAALAGAALHPMDYKCAISIAGMSDLGQMLSEDSRLYGRDSATLESLRDSLGNVSNAKLADISPARRAGEVRAPILLIHGDRDTIVRPAQSQLMADRLRDAGRPYELVILENENHYLTRTATRTQTLEALERFLAKNLPVN